VFLVGERAKAGPTASPVKTEDANREVTTPRAAGSNWVAQDGRR